MSQLDTIRRRIHALKGSQVTRFAPSPTGYLHLGHVLSAAYVWGVASAIRAKVLVRIEDHDQGRARPDYIKAIADDLSWLGFLDLPVTSPQEIKLQSRDSFSLFAETAERLRPSIYRCVCSRRQIQDAQGEDRDELRYPNTCRDAAIAWSEPGSLRLKIPNYGISFDDLCLGPQTQCPQEQCGDVMIRDRHDYWSYQFAVVVDDCHDGVNLIIRGQDLTHTTARQIMIADMIGSNRRVHYLHHPLVYDDNGKKLSKRDQASSIGELRDQGWSPEDVIGQACFAAGMIPKVQPVSACDLGDFFS
ncbi:glutamate--tRNA ligase family protein [Pseudobacteriovorax antillogorgiicola]|uniref:Glutamyl-tRNA synthetase/glutamyl-Q tRNA(Asp) synthetase n=1 Tax=Pseudobacteriovorax antillogorgiicola TaxID=1513793 RepID=A0A1Y6BVY9_9BACT|nr:glutamate--tRNA ligase family protein [Pseudobacteriovorax antillogorgiicola]TCS53880.1 glutamyl-tRNA synthetase/glutamyl-Q tRNA(Asp) synthetase [Pseudobacteriovorax antillogorgiicola]SMF21114.1 glutamyl-tRNA synthetase/glutamyl-Q tRNA(Asp) synthetase [Pseudobacteriovorax antillogorgiicola]